MDYYKQAVLSLCLATSLFIAQNVAGVETRVLSRTYPLQEIDELVKRQDSFNLFPKISDRKAWTKLPEEIRQALVTRGEQSLDYRYTGVAASAYLDGVAKGSYRETRAMKVAARRHLNNMVIAECIEDKGRFLRPIVDLVWSIAEESSWTSLSHFYLHKERDAAKLVLALPDVSDPLVDLWSATTAKNFSWIYYLLGERLDDMTPRISNRIKFEVKHRVLDPAYDRDDFWWMGFSGDNRGIVNNWNPWISSNWLAAILLVENPEEQSVAIHKLLRVIDKFIDSYGTAGGIDEGPAYWDRAAGSLFETLSMLYTWSDGAISVYDNPKIRNMMQYIYHAHIDGSYIVNFTDAPARLNPDAELLYRIGVQIKDQKLRQFAAQFKQPETSIRNGVYYPRFHSGQPDIDRELYPLFYPGLASEKPAFPYIRDAWYPRVEHMMARSVEGSNAVFFVGAKGGHNNESHNHNDVGNFILYHNGDPVFIDAGAGSYSLKTFGNARYSLWNMQSAYHNLPTINGQFQEAGRAYQADDVNYEISDTQVKFVLDIAAAYPKAAGVDSWRRTINLQRGGNDKDRVTLQETIQLRTKPKDTSLNFLTPHQVDSEPGQMIIKKASGNIRLGYDAQTFDARVEEFSLAGTIFADSWQVQSLYRIVLTLKKMSKRQSWVLDLAEQ